MRPRSPDYNLDHARIRRANGPATMYLCEGGCGGRAAHWATVHGRSGQRPMIDRVPLCVRCHTWYDRQPATDAAHLRQARYQREYYARRKAGLPPLRRTKAKRAKRESMATPSHNVRVDAGDWTGMAGLAGQLGTNREMLIRRLISRSLAAGPEAVAAWLNGQVRDDGDGREVLPGRYRRRARRWRHRACRTPARPPVPAPAQARARPQAIHQVGWVTAQASDPAHSPASTTPADRIRSSSGIVGPGLFLEVALGGGLAAGELGGLVGVGRAFARGGEVVDDGADDRLPA